MASTNFKVFNEEMSSDRTYSDAEYSVATQRQGGVIPGMALSRMHNKMYRQSTAMAKAIADFLVAQGLDCMDNDVPSITSGLQAAILSAASSEIGTHNTSLTAHADLLHLHKSVHNYAVGDIAYSPNLPSYAYLECTVTGTTAAAEPTWPSVGQTVTDGMVTWKVCDIRQGTSIGRIPVLIDVGSGVAGLPAVDGSLLTGVVSSGTGWVKFSNGTLIQYGIQELVPVGSPATQTYSLPTSFYSSNIFIVTSHIGNSVATNTVGYVSTVTQLTLGHNQATPQNICYIAFGRWKA